MAASRLQQEEVFKQACKGLQKGRCLVLPLRARAISLGHAEQRSEVGFLRARSGLAGGVCEQYQCIQIGRASWSSDVCSSDLAFKSMLRIKWPLPACSRRRSSSRLAKACKRADVLCCPSAPAR